MKDEFQKLLSRYVAGRCTEEEIRAIDEWFEQIADRDLQLNPDERNEVERRMLKEVLSAKDRRKKRRFLASVSWRIAASLTLLVVVAYLWTRKDDEQVAFLEEHRHRQETGETVNEITNTDGSVQTITLPDSSFVELSPGSTIRYARRWADATREVWLTGDAFFNVRKDPTRPFLVYSGSVVTRVLGTSFSVSAPAGAKSVEVMVRTGKVSVFDNAQRVARSEKTRPADSVVLKPNEKAKYYIEHKHWVTGLIDKPKPVTVDNIDRNFIFNDTPLKEIIDHIAVYYEIEVIVENEAAVDCSFTGDVSRMELHDMLTIICGSIGTRYEVKGSKILITGDGCQP